MADTGEDREIKQRVNARQAEIVRESNQLRQRNRAGQPAKNARRDVHGRLPSEKPTPRPPADPAQSDS
jgi:hypothetical protein